MAGFASLDRAVRRLGQAVPGLPEESRLDTKAAELDRFLASVERRAFRVAQIALRSADDAHDVVQTAMLRLAQHYARHPSEQWTPLFYRILHNAIRDLQRRQSVRQRFLGWLPGQPRHAEQATETDPLEQVADPQPDPGEQLAQSEAMARLEHALRALPERQFQAFTLRCLEGLDVAATAAAMGCSTGSVKTHYFRALQNLRARLDEVYP